MLRDVYGVCSIHILTLVLQTLSPEQSLPAIAAQVMMSEDDIHSLLGRFQDIYSTAMQKISILEETKEELNVEVYEEEEEEELLMERHQL
ncbi:hypothetical protein EON65_07595 [archaeon]|nr:MAG: hypothetical protein EON65_07595 [archaeon]